ncbi:hypothetical protein OPV22_009370 [Ensete ventricosum]|uniref:Uncharacterized protein n=1 Tax=Ensete ventricosum TaxID=4639 RepID=A0AAV8R520_ENSVE|nr:hypothetical protein OPV22_009370 [Ensete ventricosum]
MTKPFFFDGLSRARSQGSGGGRDLHPHLPSAPPSTSTLSCPWSWATPPCSSSSATPASSPSSLASIISSDGPVYEIKDYIESMEHKGIRAPSINSPLPSPLRATLCALLQAATYILLSGPCNLRGHVVADVYYKLIEKGKKPGFFGLPATQTDSAVWHVLSL